MAVNREDTARQYLDQHRIPELLQRLTELLLYHQPEHPSTFLIEELKKLQVTRSTKKDLPCFFDSSNIDTIFGVLDPCERGYITLKQYTEAMVTLDAQGFNSRPEGAEEDKITLSVFRSEGQRGLLQASVNPENTQPPQHEHLVITSNYASSTGPPCL
uniref:EF-hand calcium-binding domain-containing protein 10 n=1 Tax=Myxine glutinosa TaxID=7769 RepID=UPI00358E113D